MGLLQLGVHRAYAVDTLLTIWSNLHSRAQAKAARPVTIDFFWILYKWLDTCEAPRDKANAFAIGITFGDLTRQGLFSYRRYLQVLIARGHSARSRLPSSKPSHHLPLLEAMPIFVQAKELLEQRKLALCGDDTEASDALEVSEKRLLEDFKDEVKEYIPQLFGLGASRCAFCSLVGKRLTARGVGSQSTAEGRRIPRDAVCPGAQSIPFPPSEILAGESRSRQLETVSS
jgi:mediator of RNA polymerase II transcription subunit 12